ncbi:hypothetical protein M2428_003380 [Arthrobacter sp. ES3-54]|nr:hypothetical protein [Arthrobacter sp. ES3-54]
MILFRLFEKGRAAGSVMKFLPPANPAEECLHCGIAGCPSRHTGSRKWAATLKPDTFGAWSVREAKRERLLEAARTFLELGSLVATSKLFSYRAAHGW